MSHLNLDKKENQSKADLLEFMVNETQYYMHNLQVS